MKIVYGICISAITVLGFYACKKGNNNDKSSPNLELNKSSTISQGEPVLFTLNAAAGSDVKWKVWPDTAVVINPNGNTASITFSRSGNFVVTATSGSSAERREVSVSNKVHSTTYDTTWHLVPLTGDELKIDPIKIDSNLWSGATSGVILSVRTKNNYHCLNNYIKYDTVFNASGYSIDFLGVKIPPDSACYAGEAKSYASIPFYPVADGTHPISIKLNGVVYNGSITQDNTGITFVWPYTSGITFTRLHLPK
ncbi:hypothetical protein HHL16_19770 [Pseudoflavitalea sp. G-6-1-2]|uniref:hypothetical protein n=1 Tax=Pseudoflavitalea sp. G-6-1-2 TaxID=2728841 RepID=UPI001469AFC4|nr:hypothetical protein [Pseudoflavitalea sp. G-6-1-2]NML23125.1 hypothetical protein [Pseudoflavitalea sp. G-6-1-2]